MPLRVRFGKSRPAFAERAPEPDQSRSLAIRWTPEALPIGEIMPLEDLASLARSKREAQH